MTTDTVGGVWRYCLEAARALSRLGVTIELATLGPPASPEQWREAEAIDRLTLVDTGRPLDWMCGAPEDVTDAAKAVAALARDFGADLVQLNGVSFAAEARFDVPVLAVHHSCLATWWRSVKQGPLPPDWVWRRDLVKRHLLATAGVATPSRSFSEITSAVYDLRERPEVIFNGRSEPAAVSREPPERALFTSGRLWDEGKNITTIDEAAESLDAPVFAAGPQEGPNGVRVSLANVRALGEIPETEVRKRLARRPVFVSSALYEPFGLAVLEAAQAGCALLLSDIPTFRELWGEAATFAPAHDPRAFARAATDLLENPSRRARLGEAARLRSARYGVARMGEALHAWHRGALGDRETLPRLEATA
jgi:glycosyltransferase involved in cell wall biosynthesis